MGGAVLHVQGRVSLAAAVDFDINTTSAADPWLDV